MKRPNRSGSSGNTAPERSAVKILVFTYFAVTAILLVSLAGLISEHCWPDPLLARQLALTLCHTSFRVAVLGVVSGLILDIAARMRQ